MSAWSTIIYNMLVIGTWTNYGECPTIIILYKGSLRVRGTYILLEDEDEEPTSDHKGKILTSLKSGILSIYSGNETNRDKIRNFCFSRRLLDKHLYPYDTSCATTWTNNF